MAFPDIVAAELLAHELLEQHLADRFQGGIRQQKLDTAATVFHVDTQLDQDRRIGRPGDSGKARIGFQTVEIETDRGQRFESGLGII